MTEKSKNHFNASMHIALPNSISYDRKIHKAIAPYIEEHLWKHMDKDRVKKAVFILDDPLLEYKNDYKTIKIVLKKFLPKIKKLLAIDENNQLKDMLTTTSWISSFIDRNIKQRVDLYMINKTSRGYIVEVLQTWPKKGYTDLTQPYTKKIINDTVPNIQKSIIANIMILMILEEEINKQIKNTPKKIIHKIEKDINEID